MARTQAADFEQRREAIVDRAAELFAEHGFSETSVADLATACATSKSLVYHYYKSKEEILYAVMSSHVDQLIEDTAAAGGPQADAPGKLRALLHAFMSHYVGAVARQKVLLNELNSLPAAKRSVIVAKQRSVVEAVQALIVEIDSKLGAEPQHARVKTMLVLGMINWTHTWFDPTGPVSADDVAEMAFDLVMSGTRTQAS